MKVICLSDISGFPHGEATANRIKMIGKALQYGGMDFSVYSAHFNKFTQNDCWKGTEDGIYFEYLHKDVAINNSKLKKIWLILLSYLRLIALLFKASKEKWIVYIFSHAQFFNLITIVLCKFFKLKIVQEINEWDYNLNRFSFGRFMYRGPMIKWSDGAIVISESIKDNVIQVRSNFPTIKIPILADSEQTTTKKEFNQNVKHQYGLWIGYLHVAYLRDVLLFADAIDYLTKQGIPIKGIACGRYSNHAKAEVFQHTTDANFELKGYVSEEELDILCANAAFFIAPLWHDQKSINRFPTKIATYLLYAKPVITCQIGEVGNYLTNKENVLFYASGNSKDLADKIQFILNNEHKAIQIGELGRKFAINNFDFRKFSAALVNFFDQIIKS